MTLSQVVERERRLIWRLHAVAGVLLAAAAAGVVLAAGALALGHARWLALPRVVPFVIWLLLAGVVGVVALLTARRLRRDAGVAPVASAIEREQSLRSGALRGALEVADQGPLGRRAADSLASQLGRTSGTLAPNHYRIARHAAITGAGAAAIVLLLLGAAAPSDGMSALLRPASAWRGTLLPSLAFHGLPRELVRGESLTVRVRAPGRTHIELHQRRTGAGWAALSVPVDTRTGEAVARLGPLDAPLTIVASDGRASTDTARVLLAERPYLGGVTVRAVFPDYLGRTTEVLTLGEPARLPRGTRLELSGRASTALRSVRLEGSGVALPLAVDGHTFRGSVQARDGEWRWVAAGAAGPIAELPAPLQIDIVPDSVPQVTILAPAGDTMVAADDRIALRASASDDHGLSSVVLTSVRYAGGKRGAVLAQPLASGVGALWSGDGELSLAGRGLGPGDELHVTVVATDNSPWRQQGASRELVLRIPTTEERRSLTRTLADSVAREAASTAAAERALAQRTDELSRSRGDRSPDTSPDAASGAQGGVKRNDDAMSYAAAERAKAVAQEQEALADRVNKLRESAASLERQLQQAGALDSSLARQLHEAQQLLREALSPELVAQMQKLQQSAQQLQGDQARQTLRDLAMMQQRLREQLEKSAEMLRRAALEGQMQTLRDEAAEIAQRERALADSASQRLDSASARSLAGRSSRLSADMQQLQSSLEREGAETGASHAAEAQRHAAASAEAMQRAAGGQRSLQQGASDAADQMQRAAEAMKVARQAQVSEWKQELTQELDRSIQEMLQMARQESAMEQQARAGEKSAQELRGTQSAVEQGVQKTAQRLQEAGRKSSLLSGGSQRAVAEAQEKVSQAQRQLGQQAARAQASGGVAQSTSESAHALGDAAEALNRAAASLARDRERANSASSASGFSEMLQEMQQLAKRQGGINAQAQSLLAMPGGASSPGAQATARQLARQQRGLAQQLDDMGNAPGGDRAGELAKEARRVAEALDAGRLDATTLARQQQLYRRLLDAGKSLEKDEREDTGKREAQAADGSVVYTPTNTSASGRSTTKFQPPTWNELRGLSAEERRAVLEYFARLNAQSKP